jgi:hypothetical protein
MSHTIYAANGKVSHIHRRMCEWDYTIIGRLIAFSPGYFVVKVKVKYGFVLHTGLAWSPLSYGLAWFISGTSYDSGHSVVSDIQDLGSPLHFMLRRSSLVECVSVLHGTCLQCVEFFFVHQYVQPCLSKNHKYTLDLLNKKRKGDPKSRSLSRTSDTTEIRNPCVIKVILLACFTYIDIFLIF